MIEIIILAASVAISATGLIVAIWSVRDTRKKFYDEYRRRKIND